MKNIFKGKKKLSLEIQFRRKSMIKEIVIIILQNLNTSILYEISAKMLHLYYKKQGL